MTALEFYQHTESCRYINRLGFTAQSALETGYWTSYLWTHANNGAGIKAHGDWHGDILVIESPEYIDGKNTIKTSTFRKYASIGLFIDDYEKKIRKGYPRSVKNADNIWGYFAGLEGKWATDPRYFGKLVINTSRIAPMVLGREWRARLKEAYELAIERTTLTSTNKVTIQRMLQNDMY